MQVLQKLHQDHKARHAAINGRAVADNGIDLKRLPPGFTARPAQRASSSLRFDPQAAPAYAIRIVAAQPAQPVEVVRMPKRPTAQTIIRRVAAHYNVEVEEILGPDRHQPLTRYRQIAMYLCREVLPHFYTVKSRKFSLPELGYQFGRDHATVHHACHKIEDLMKFDAVLTAEVEILRAELMAKTE